jgi:hypothetical protein
MNYHRISQVDIDDENCDLLFGLGVIEGLGAFIKSSISGISVNCISISLSCKGWTYNYSFKLNYKFGVDKEQGGTPPRIISNTFSWVGI